MTASEGRTVLAGDVTGLTVCVVEERFVEADVVVLPPPSVTGLRRRRLNR